MRTKGCADRIRFGEEKEKLFPQVQQVIEVVAR